MVEQRRFMQHFGVRRQRRSAILIELPPYWRALLAVALMQLTTSALCAVPAFIAPPSQQEYWAQFDRKDWDGAIASAEALVAALRPASPATALRLSEALSLLGSAQLGKGNLVAAEAAFTESLKLAEQHSGNGSANLVEPLRGLGYTLAAQGKHAPAIPLMDRALILSRRNAGLFDISQQGLLRQLGASLTEVGQPAEAERHMLYMLRVGEHAYGVADPRMSPLHCLVGEWYEEIGQVDMARQSFRTALGIVERKLGPNDLATVEPLRALADSYPREVVLSRYGVVVRSERMPSNVDGTGIEGEPLNPRFLGPDGERALTRALKVMDANKVAEGSAERSKQTLIETLLQTGDWFLMKDQPAKALPYYQRADSMIAKESASGAADHPNVSALGFPRQVYYPTPSLATRNLQRPPSEVVERFVQVEFTVRQDGSVADERVADKDATERQVSQTLEAIGEARYRPKFADGKPVDTALVSYRQVFRQRKEAE